MATQKPISTISYNTEPFLREKLDNLVDKHIISDYMFIFHKGEDGDKDHFHLRVEPNKRIDPMDLTEIFKEYDGKNPLPLGVKRWQYSDEDNWILYVIHHEQYLIQKYGPRESWEKGEKLPYHWEEIQGNNTYMLESRFTHALGLVNRSNKSLLDRIEQGTSARKLVEEGISPFLVSQLTKFVKDDSYKDLTTLQAKYDVLEDKYILLRKSLSRNGIEIEYDENIHDFHIYKEIEGDLS